MAMNDQRCRSTPVAFDPAAVTRRHFFAKSAAGLGSMALASLFPQRASATLAQDSSATSPHFAPRAKRIIYLFQSGGPAQQDLFDYKPLLNERNGQQLPAHVRQGQRLTAMSSSQSSIPLAGSQFRFARHGHCGAWVSELLPHSHAPHRGRLVFCPFHVHRSHQPRSGDHLLSDRLPARRPARHGFLAFLRFGFREPKPAGVHRSRQRGPRRTTVVCSPLGQRLSRFTPPRRALSIRQRPGLVSQQSRRHLPIRPARDARPSQRTQSNAVRARARSRN